MVNHRTLFLFALTIALGGCVQLQQRDGSTHPPVNPEQAAQARLALGMQYLNSGEFAQAKYNLDKAEAFAPKSVAVTLGQAHYFSQVGAFEHAETRYQRALTLAPNNADTHNNYGVLLCRAERYGEGIYWLIKATKQQNYFRIGESFENAARCATKQGDSDAALRYYQQALQYAPQDSSVLEGYSGLLLTLERWQQAQWVLRNLAQQPRKSAQYLWLEVQLAQALGDKQRAQKFGALLVDDFPRASQTQRYQQRLKSYDRSTQPRPK